MVGFAVAIGVGVELGITVGDALMIGDTVGDPFTMGVGLGVVSGVATIFPSFALDTHPQRSRAINTKLNTTNLYFIR